MTRLRILIGCETSGRMRRAMAALGHDVWSVDLLPADDGSNRHIIGDVRDHLYGGWDMAVLHPGRSREEIWDELDEGAALFSACWTAPIERVAIENPIMHRHALKRLPADLPRPQIVQPWWFGEPFFKATGFYLRGLPRLVATSRLTPPKRGTDEHKAWSALHRASPGPDRWKIRSRTFQGVAEACATQWAGPVAAEREARS